MLSDLEYQIEDFILYCTSKNLSKKTIASYEQSLKLFARFISKELAITSAEKVKTNHIR
ncbi:MAG TPA: site-specific integrase, partial [Syntrophomonas sp.]|nr:site-specific integrase [Syntrophomonas sp.]